MNPKGATGRTNKGLIKAVCAGLIGLSLLATAASVRAGNHEHYLPLEVGNSWTYTGWTYKNGTEEITFTITGTEEINGHTYYKFDDYFYVFHYYPPPPTMGTMGRECLLRYDPASDNILMYHEGKDIVRYDFSGYYWTGFTCNVPAGEFNNCYKFEFLHILGFGYTCIFGEYLAPNVGVVKYVSPGNGSKEGKFVTFELKSYTFTRSPLVELEIAGPQQVPANYDIRYRAIAHYGNNSTQDVTNLARWRVEPNDAASIDAGLLRIEDINEHLEITIYAAYSEDEAALEAAMAVSLREPIILRVPSDWPTIQAAIDAANDYEVVLVADGNHTDTGNFDIDFRGKAITVKSENGPEKCIIDCNNKGRGFYFHSNEYSNSALRGFTITNGKADYGGGIRCVDAGGRIRDIRCLNGSSPTITNCIIKDNSARYGGGISCHMSSPTIANCAISGNSADDRGGGICCRFRSPTVSNCTISGNEAGQHGGGMWNDYSDPAVTNCIFWANTAGADGNEIYNSSSFSDPTFSYCDIADCGGSDNWDPNFGIDGEGNIDEDPCFVNPGYRDANEAWVNGDYHLLPFSLCMNAGNPDYIPAPGETDIDGLPRVIGDRIDMGAYESDYIRSKLWILPRTINRRSRQRRILALLRLPEGITRDQIDRDSPLVLYPGQIESTRQFVIQSRRRAVEHTAIFAFFDKPELMAAISSQGRVKLHVIGRLKTGQYFHGSDTIRIIDRGRRQ